MVCTEKSLTTKEEKQRKNTGWIKGVLKVKLKNFYTGMGSDGTMGFITLE